jgi:predicted ATPase/DNA-binding winged helix-turn-helix (wHTH) protein
MIRTEDVCRFGPFLARRGQRELLLEGKPIRLGARAFEVLMALVERAGEVVSKDELIARVWPTTHVDEANIRVHIGALRKLLGDGQKGARYIATIPGEGYSFVAAVTTETLDSATLPARSDARETPQALAVPRQLTRMIGRAAIASRLAEQLPVRRLVTIVGPGGIGKTTLAVAIASDRARQYDHGVVFVDLATHTSDPASALASLLGTSSSSGDVDGLAGFLAERRMLIVLDNCEHVVEATAALAESLVRGAPGVEVLATSREPLRAEGEFVHRLASLDTPPRSEAMTADNALDFSAVQLFVERAMDSSDGYQFTDEDAPIVSELCRRLDGIPLAIELAAARIEVFGARGLAERLDDRLSLLTKGRRTALPRHQTLRATVDWSYETLSARDRTVLRWLATFRSPFTLQAAIAVASGDQVDAAGAIESLTELATKSLVSVDATEQEIRYRLLEMTRAYAWEKLVESGESAIACRRHAEYHRDLFANAERDWAAPSRADWLLLYGRRVDDVFAALDWAFAPGGDVMLGAELMVGAGCLGPQLSLHDAFRLRLQRALDYTATIELPQPMRDRFDMICRFEAAIFNTDDDPRFRPLTAYLDIAKPGDDGLDEFVIESIWARLFSRADYKTALVWADRLEEIKQREGLEGNVHVNRLMALTHHYLGDQAKASTFANRPVVAFAKLHPWHIDIRVSRPIILGRISWLQGFPDQAAELAREAFEQAMSLEHAASICYAAAFAACPIALWNGDTVAAQSYLSVLMTQSRTSRYWSMWSACFAAALAGARTEPSVQLTAKHFDMLGTLGVVSDVALARVERGEVGWCAAEVLRASGEAALRRHGPSPEVEALFLRSLSVAREQRVRAWELRAATSLAALWARGPQRRKAATLLRGMLDRYTQGFATRDVSAAGSLLEQLESS